MRRAIFYGLLVAFTVYAEVMYDGFYGTALLFFELGLAIALLLLALYLKRCVRAEFSVPQEHDGVHRIELTAKNTGILPVSRLTFRLEGRNHCCRDGVGETVVIRIPARGEARAVCTADLRYCGRYCFRTVKGRVWDYLGLFALPVECRNETWLNVLPEPCLMEVSVSSGTRYFMTDGEEYDQHRSGDDPSETFQVREFRDGDSLQRVHWKLSAKAGALMTRELGRPVGCSVLLLADTRIEAKEEAFPERMDALLRTVVSLSFSLQEAALWHHVAWMETEGIARAAVREEEQVYEMAERLMGAKACREGADPGEVYREAYPGTAYARVLRVTAEPAVYVNGERAVTFERGDLEEQLSGCRIEV